MPIDAHILGIPVEEALSGAPWGIGVLLVWIRGRRIGGQTRRARLRPPLLRRTRAGRRDS